MRSRSEIVLALAFLLSTSLVAAQMPASDNTDPQKEADTAQSLYTAQNFAGALPLYEDLHKREPQSNVYRERLAMCLIGAPAPTDADKAASVQRAHQLLLDARAAGDNSNLLQTVLEKLETPVASSPAGAPSPGREAFQRAEKAFSSGDLPAALKGYAEAFAADPKLYEAPLYAGDTEYKQGHYAEADKWYAQAAMVNPDRETAYRYWGDNLMKRGKTAEAENKFIDAIIAEPYTRTPRIGLKQWADVTHVVLAPPPITLPARAQPNAKGNMQINLDPSSTSSPTLGAMMAYSMGSALWQTDKFAKAYPDEKQYRHSLAEEVDSIHTALSVLKYKNLSPDKLDSTWRSLLALDKDGMIECWILIDHADQGIAQDYVVFRAQHRDLLHAYIAKYDVHPAN
jgi:tetratricopeptide (TPR) repeat protein